MFRPHRVRTSEVVAHCPACRVVLESGAIGMSDYRDVPLQCPACGDVMEQRLLSDCTVDTCPKCRGLWVDWFDGEILSIVKETAPLSFRAAIEIDPAKAKCPRCTQPLIPETFNNAIVLLRCSECAGCFVPRESFTSL